MRSNFTPGIFTAWLWVCGARSAERRSEANFSPGLIPRRGKERKRRQKIKGEGKGRPWGDRAFGLKAPVDKENRKEKAKDAAGSRVFVKDKKTKNLLIKIVLEQFFANAQNHSKTREERKKIRI